MANWDDWTTTTRSKVTLRLDDEEIGVVFDALMEHQRTNELRHAAATARGDTVSTTGDRVEICRRVMDRLHWAV